MQVKQQLAPAKPIWSGRTGVDRWRRRRSIDGGRQQAQRAIDHESTRRRGVRWRLGGALTSDDRPGALRALADDPATLHRF